MSRLNGSSAARARRSENFGRKILTGSLVQALRATRTTRAAAARMMGITSRTLRRWFKLETPVEASLVLNVPKLAAHFTRCLNVHAVKRERAERKAA